MHDDYRTFRYTYLRASPTYGRPSKASPTFIKAGKPALDLGTGKVQLSNYAAYAIRKMPTGVALKIDEAGFTANDLDELATHLTALAKALRATA